MTMTTPRSSSRSSTFKDVTCTFCGCLCDDIALTVEENRIIEAKHACSLGQSWFLAQVDEVGPACLVDGQPASLEQCIEAATRILLEARYPIIYGLSEATSESQRLAASIADWIGGCIDATSDVTGGASTIAFQEVGEVTCTLGEIKNRGDLIVFWRSNPVETHPRHFERYSLDAQGEFVSCGRQDRYCVVVDVASTATSEAADEFIAINPRGEFEALWTLRALAKGIELDPAVVETETGVPLWTWQALIAQMKRAKYGAILFGSGSTAAVDHHLVSHAILALARDLNDSTRFVAMKMAGGGNPTGAENVLTWRTGYPFAVNLTRGHPGYGPGEYDANSSLSRGEPDAALIVAGDPVAGLSSEAREHLARIPTVMLVPECMETTRSATVMIRASTYGISSPGTVYRMDGVPIPLRPALTSALPSVEKILKAIEGRVRGAHSTAT